jgi:hypothetical protein
MHKEIQNVCYLMDWDMFILGLRLLFLTNVSGATSITRAKSIPDSRVVIFFHIWLVNGMSKVHILIVCRTL